MNTHARSSRRLLRRTGRVLALALGLAFFILALPPHAIAATDHQGPAFELAERTPLATLVADPQAWSGKRVQVEGTVTDVCPKKGCWMMLRDGDAALRIKVEDDVIIIPRDAIGKRAAAEGTVRVLELDRERYVGWLAHLAEERGETFDPTTVEGEGPFEIVQIAGDSTAIDADAPTGSD